MRTLRSFWARIGTRRLAVWCGRSAAIFVAVCIAAFLFFPHAWFNRYLRDRITSAFEEAVPGCTVSIRELRYDVLANRLECDSIDVVTADSAFTCSMAGLTVENIARMHLLWNGTLSPARLAETHIDARRVTAALNRYHYTFQCARLQLSGDDSTVAADSVEFLPSHGDEEFFSASPFRKTRFHIAVVEFRAAGIDVRGLMEGKTLRARTVHGASANLSILINKDAPVDEHAPPPPSPAELLATVDRAISFDSIAITNGRVSYNEQFARKATPAGVTLDSVEMVLRGVRNNGEPGDSALLAARGVLMRESRVEVEAAIPVAAPELSFRYAGSMSRIQLSAFNPFIEISEHMRLKTGVLHEASFGVSVRSGVATGTARVAYEDLKIVAIDDRTGSESGVGNTIVSMLANNIKLRTTNLPDEKGSMKIGSVHYTKQSSEAFLEFSWFALRSGLSDVIGF